MQPGMWPRFAIVVWAAAAWSAAALDFGPAEPGTNVVVDAGGGTALGKHSSYLMGITAYGRPDTLSQPLQQQLMRELDIRTVGVQV